MLDRGGYALALYAVDEADGHARCEERVLAKVFEITRRDGRPVDIDARREQEMPALRACVAAELHPDALGEFRVPGGSQGDAAAESRCRTIVADAHWPVDHPEPRYTQPRDAPQVEEVDARDEVDLLFQGHLSEYGLDTALCFFVGQIGGACLRNDRD